jgi:hypothetical protein
MKLSKAAREHGSGSAKQLYIKTTFSSEPPKPMTTKPFRILSIFPALKSLVLPYGVALKKSVCIAVSVVGNLY